VDVGLEMFALVKTEAMPVLTKTLSLIYIVKMKHCASLTLDRLWLVSFENGK
jgi:hypothetical protein